MDQRGAPVRPRAAGVPDRPRGGQARGPDDAQRAQRRRGHGDPPDRDDGRRGGQRRVLHRLPRARRAAAGRGGQRLAAADVRAERGAADPGRADAGRGRARVRRRAGLRQGARAVRAADRLVPDHQTPAGRPGHRDRVLPPADLRRGGQGGRQPGRDVPARGLDGQAQGHRDRQEDGARGHADDGRLRLRHRVRHGGATCAPRSCPRSTAAPARSSATSSAAPTACDRGWSGHSRGGPSGMRHTLPRRWYAKVSPSPHRGAA